MSLSYHPPVSSDAQGGPIGEHAQAADGEDRPPGAVHLPLDGAHGREAGGAEQIEAHEGKGRQPAVAAGEVPEVL
ncbi:MAG: hypothetical protein IJQ93_10955 [Bacteroidales bacterium]|nr:hypothetical protein [Bacteroidales bacterium]